MYEEIIKELMKAEIWLMLFWIFLLLVLPTSIYTYVSHKEKKKKRKKKKKWNSFQESAADKALAFVIAGILFFCVLFGISLYRYLSLREDMVTENYVTYVGEFRHYVVRGRSSMNEYVEWTDEKGETVTVEYNYHIDKFRSDDRTLETGTYNGTIVYSPSSGLLLWWDAVPVEK